MHIIYYQGLSGERSLPFGLLVHAPDNHSNQEVNVDVISNVMTFLPLRLKLIQCIVSKDHISMNNGDNFIKFAD